MREDMVMEVGRRGFLATMTGAGLAVATPQLAEAQPGGGAVFRKRLTGVGTAAARRWGVVGAELGVPYLMGNTEVGFLFGDTFATARPEDGTGWRSMTILRSGRRPGGARGIVLDGAVGVSGDGQAPGVVQNGHRGIGIDGVWEETVLPTDGVSLPDGRQVVSYVSVEHREGARTSYAGLAYSDDGNDFVRTNLKWWNDAENSDPYQLWTMQRDGKWVYVFSVPAGRRTGGMMLRRVRWDRMQDLAAYEGWGWNGRDWAWGRSCTPILTGHFGEPSVRRLSDGTWVMSYLNAATKSIVTRTATRPNGEWSPEKVQLKQPHLYGGFIHPWSTSRPNDLHLLVSTGKHYHVSQYIGTV